MAELTKDQLKAKVAELKTENTGLKDTLETLESNYGTMAKKFDDLKKKKAKQKTAAEPKAWLIVNPSVPESNKVYQTEEEAQEKIDKLNLDPDYKEKWILVAI